MSPLPWSGDSKTASGVRYIGQMLQQLCNLWNISIPVSKIDHKMKIHRAINYLNSRVTEKLVHRKLLHVHILYRSIFLKIKDGIIKLPYAFLQYEIKTILKIGLYYV